MGIPQAASVPRNALAAGGEACEAGFSARPVPEPTPIEVRCLELRENIWSDQ